MAGSYNKLVKHHETINVESALNFFNANIIKTRIEAGEKPEPWTVDIENSKVKSVFFEPTMFITPTEAIIQRVIMGMVRNLIYSFEGTPEEFEAHEFEIRTHDIASLLEKKRLNREIRTAFDKLMRFRVKVFVPEWKKTFYEGILKSGNYNEGSDVWKFKANPMFQIMRQEQHRNQNILSAVGKNEETGKVDYKKVFINLNDLLLLDSKVHKIILFYFIIDFEKSNCTLKNRIYLLDPNWLAKVFNKPVSKITKNDSGKFKKAIDEIMAMEQYEGLFIWHGKKQGIRVNFR